MTATLPVYLDYMATTPVDPRVAEAMLEYLGPQGTFGNPASVTHAYGLQARKAVEIARAQVAELINAEPREIIWTSGATESDNLAVKGAARFYRRNGNHIITCKTEHKAVLDSCQQLEKEGFVVTYLEPETNGLIDLAKLKNAIQKDTILISIMYVNNEIGVIQDIAAIGAVAKAHGLVFHVDAAQAAGKISIDIKTLPVDLMSFSGHKAYGPKGIGALYVRQKPRVRLEAMIHGGGHENGLRSGTLATHQVVGMGEAFKIAKAELSQEVAQITKLRDYFWEGIKDIDAMILNGDAVRRIPGNLNLSFAFVEGDSLILALKDLAISSSSACSSASIEPSYVLRAIRVSSALAHASIRISLGRFTTQAEIDIAIATIKEQVARLRAISTEG